MKHYMSEHSVALVSVNCDPTPQEQMYFERCVIDEIPVKQKLHIEKVSIHKYFY